MTEGGRRVSDGLAARFRALWDELAPVGRDADSGGYLRYALDRRRSASCATGSAQQAERRGLPVETDGNGNLWAWWGDPEAGDAVLTGTHLDSVPTAGRTTGRSASSPRSLAVDVLRARGRRRPPGRWWSALRRGGGRPLRPGLPGLAAAHRGARRRARGRRCATRDGVTLRPRRSATGPARRPARSWLGRHRRLRRAARRAGPRPRRPRRAGRGGQRDLAARPLALRLHRRGQPRRHHPDGGPARPDADLRDHGAGGQQAGPAAPARAPPSAGSPSSPTPPTPIPSRVTALAGRPRPPTRRRSTDLVDGDRGRRAERAAPRRHGGDGHRGVGHRAWSPSTPAWRDRLAGAARARRCCRPAPATTPGVLAAHVPDRDALRAQPDRRLALPGRARRPTPTAWPASTALADVLERAGMPVTPTRLARRARAGWPSAAPTADVLVEVDGRPVHRGHARDRSTPPAGVEVPPTRCRCPASTLPGLANAHSHAFHRALRGRTQRRAGHVLDLARADVRRRRPARPGHLPRAGPRRLRRDGAGRDHLRRGVPLPAPPARTARRTTTRTRWAQALIAAAARRRASGSRCSTPAT